MIIYFLILRLLDWSQTLGFLDKASGVVMVSGKTIQLTELLGWPLLHLNFKCKGAGFYLNDSKFKHYSYKRRWSFTVAIINRLTKYILAV